MSPLQNSRWKVPQLAEWKEGQVGTVKGLNVRSGYFPVFVLHEEPSWPSLSGRFLDLLLTCGGAWFPKPRNRPQRPSGRPTVQLHVWHYPENLVEAPDPTDKGLCSTRLTSVPSPRPPVTRLGCCLDLWPPGYKSGVLLTLFLGLINLLEQVTELRAAFHSPDHCKSLFFTSVSLYT